MLSSKNYLFACLSLLLYTESTFAQDVAENSKPRTPIKISHQVGINIASFADRFLKFNNATNLAIDPYLFSYRLQIGNNSVIRLGVGGSMTNEELTSSTSSNPRKNIAHGVDLRLGYEYYLLNLNRWKAGAGVNAIYSSSYSKSTQVNDPNVSDFIQTSSSSSVGGGLSLSIQYSVSKRVSVGTEGGLYYMKQKQKDKTEITGPSPQVSSTGSTISKINPQYPVSLFLNFNF